MWLTVQTKLPVRERIVPCDKLTIVYSCKFNKTAAGFASMKFLENKRNIQMSKERSWSNLSHAAKGEKAATHRKMDFFDWNVKHISQTQYSHKHRTPVLFFISVLACVYINIILYCCTDRANTVVLFIYSTPENDMMAFIDDDSLMDEHNRQDECRAPSPSMSLRPPHLQNGWGNSLGQRVKQQQQQMSPRKPDVQMANSNVNNNNNNNNSNNANAGNRYCSNCSCIQL